jgi:ABC-type antimicrobial peptide transport system permease subunit
VQVAYLKKINLWLGHQISVEDTKAIAQTMKDLITKVLQYFVLIFAINIIKKNFLVSVRQKSKSSCLFS